MTSASVPKIPNDKIRTVPATNPTEVHRPSALPAGESAIYTTIARRPPVVPRPTPASGTALPTRWDRDAMWAAKRRCWELQVQRRWAQMTAQIDAANRRGDQTEVDRLFRIKHREVSKYAARSSALDALERAGKAHCA